MALYMPMQVHQEGLLHYACQAHSLLLMCESASCQGFKASCQKGCFWPGAGSNSPNRAYLQLCSPSPA